MILFVDDNAGILFLKRVTGAIVEYISGTIATASTVAAILLGYGVMSVSVQTLTDVSGSTRGYGRLFVQMYGRTYISGYMMIPVWVTEIVSRVSAITKVFSKNSRIDGE
jgi:hypothetical protein